VQIPRVLARCHSRLQIQLAFGRRTCSVDLGSLLIIISSPVCGKHIYLFTETQSTIVTPAADNVVLKESLKQEPRTMLQIGPLMGPY
jgi:hypothetical protein